MPRDTIESPGHVRIVRSSVGIKSWIAQTPSVEAVRPAQCPVCGVASRPVGQKLRLYGHGLRDRQCPGPLTPGGKPEPIVIQARRYQCQACRAMLLVTPRGIAPRRHYGAAAIAWALALWSLGHKSQAAVRNLVSPNQHVSPDGNRRWRSLSRWARAAQRGQLFAGTPQVPASSSTREAAQRCCMALSAHAPSSQWHRSQVDRAFFGGERMA